ncbi:MAG: UDP-2,3-diacylglucosamine diphosphatase [Planctomycetes bacterium]|jgi:predicted phosphodiesterase|nr:UDP-2,3-diacylglucosamine diphosphatase [Planctomycetota bacterium]
MTIQSMENKTSVKKFKIDTMIISDIHLGDETTRCEEVIKLLRRYKFKKLILNGDILNGLRFKRLHTGHWKILSKLRKLTIQCEVIWVHGNHDAQSEILSQLLGIKVFNKYSWEDHGKKFLAIHGHQYDHFLHKNLLFTYSANAAYRLIKTYDRSGLLIGLIKEKSATWQRSATEVARGALRLARQTKVDYVFCGHTHKIHHTEKNGINYYNTGSWNDKPSGYITIAGDQVMLNQVD